MAQVAIDLDSQERRTFHRLLAFSALLHVAGLAALAWVPSIPTMREPAAIAVNLVAAPTLAKAPAATPAPPAARPKPRPPKPAPVVLPTEATVPKPRPPKDKPRPREEKPPPVPEAPVQENYSDVLASLREELGEETPKPTPAPVPQAAATGGSGPGTPVSAELRAWMTAAKIRIKDNWVVPASFRMAAIVTEVRLDVGAGGALVSDPQIVRGSGNPFYDDGVLRSIRKADPLPPPPEPGQWTFRFVSDEY